VTDVNREMVDIDDKEVSDGNIIMTYVDKNVLNVVEKEMAYIDDDEVNDVNKVMA